MVLNMKVLLFANIGTAPNNFYHIGDEAMFLETYNWYQKHHQNYKLSILTSQSNHSNLELSEILNPFEFQFVNKRVLLKAFIKITLFKFLKINILNKKEFSLFKIIKNQDRIHFCGGGNITSLFQGWLYYSLLIITFSLVFRKEVILTSQTIGPFNFIDKIIVRLILNKVKIIATRGDKKDIFLLKIKNPQIFNMLDAAYKLPMKSNVRISPKKYFRIGLSLHEWKSNQSFIKKLVKNLEKINTIKKIEIILLPHVIVNSKNEWDMGFMNSIFNKKNDLKIIKPKITSILTSNSETAYTLKKMTSTCDLLISTRYHGLIFALSKNIPVLTFTNDKYYSDKNINAIKHYYPKDFNFYTLNTNSLKNNQLYKRLFSVIENNQIEKKHISKINSKLLKNFNLFHNNLNQNILK